MNNSPKNPWLRLTPKAPFVLPSDRGAIDSFNLQAAEGDRLNVKLLPIPFLGRPDAPIVLLNLNPGYHPHDDKLQKQPRFMQACRRCLKHTDDAFPFFFLDPKIEGSEPGPGHRWWSRILRPLLDDNAPSFLSRALLCVEFFPYSSHRFKSLRTILDSQLYGFQLVRAAIQRGAIIVVMRSRGLWFDAIPELLTYKKVYITKNPRNPVVSNANLPDGFKQITRALERFRGRNRDGQILRGAFV